MEGESRLVISRALADDLLERGHTQESIDATYIVDDSQVEVERQERNARIAMNQRRGDYQKYQPNRAKRRKKR